MSDSDKLHPEEERIAQRVRELPHARPDEGFRDRLRAQFVSGTLEPAPAPAPKRTTMRPGLWVRWAFATAAAALVFVALFNRAPEMQLIAANGSGSVIVDGQSMPVSAEDLAAHVRPGATVQLTDDSSLDLMATDVALIEVAAGTHLTIPAAPHPMFRREEACSLFAGEMRIKTGSKFHGATLRVYTPQGVAEITGTLVSVQSDEGGTCVCVLEGVAHVGVNEGDMEPVEPGFRKVMYTGGKTEIIPVKDMHRDGLVDFDARMGDRIQPAR